MTNQLTTEKPEDYRSKSRLAAKLLCITLAYFASGRLGLAIPYVGSHITLVWLPTGIAVAALLRWGWGMWPGIFLGAFLVNLSIDSTWLLAGGIAVGNTLGPSLTAWVLRRTGFHQEIDRYKDFLLLGMAAILGMLLSALVGTINLNLAGSVPPDMFVSALLAWWMGDAVGVFLAMPLLLTATHKNLVELWKQRTELLIGGLFVGVLLCIVLFGNFREAQVPLISLTLLMVIWPAMRFGLMAASIAVLVFSMVAAASTAMGYGPFHGSPDELFLLWSYISTLILSGLMVSVLLAERNAAQMKIESLLRRNQAMMKTAADGIHILDMQGNVIEANDSFCHILGYTRDEVVLLNVADWDRRFSAEELRARIKEFIEQSTGATFETIHQRKDGTLVDVEVSVSGLIIEGARYLFATSRDITQRKKSDAIMVRHKRVIETAMDGFMITDLQGNLLEVNQAYANMMGYTIDELLKMHISQLEAQEDIEDIRVHIATIIERGHDRFETRYRRKDGQVIDAEVSVTTIPETQQFFVFCHDITARKQGDEISRIAAVTFETQEAIMITDPDGRILRINQAFQEVFGYSAAEVVGKNPRIFQSGRHGSAFYQAMWADLLSNGKWSGEIWDRRKNGEIFPSLMAITAVHDSDHQLTHYVAISHDISRRKQSEQEIHQLAFYDSLTKLPNRRLLLERLQQAVAVSVRNGWHGALMFLDLDHFKTINDTQGHALGDRLLVEVSRRLQGCVREGDSIARLGGDEFVVVLAELSSEAEEAATQTELVAEKIRNELGKPYVLDDFECLSSVSIGVSLFRGHHESMEDLLKHADVAMYQAKSAGRNTIRFFDPHMQTALEARAVLEADLRRALEKQQFSLFYQIQVDSLRRPLGAEVLLRWHHPERGLVSPLQFISLAEETGLIVPIGLWVLQTACHQLKAWQRHALTRDLTLAVNVSAKQFRQSDFVAQVQNALFESGAKHSLLKLELTESTVLENVEDTIAKMQELKLSGVGFSMDDFGTGYSSLQYLKRLPLDQIKIDQSFVRDIASDQNDAAIVQTIIAMTEALGLNVIAEGVETEMQREFLDLRGCHAFQGYLFSQPIPLDKFESMLRGLR